MRDEFAPEEFLLDDEEEEVDFPGEGEDLGDDDLDGDDADDDLTGFGEDEEE